jgi:hypothetical protein
MTNIPAITADCARRWPIAKIAPSLLLKQIRVERFA